MDADNKNQNTPTTDFTFSLDSLADINWTQEFLDNYQNCVLCGSELIFTHNTHFIQLSVEEEAHCSHCNVRNRKQSHRLQ